jgi:hypothetical protein
VLAIHPGQLDKARYTIDPNNNELQNFLATRHAECILPPLRAGEAANEADVIKREEIRMKGEEDNKKKDCIKDMHPSIASMILMLSEIEHNQQGDYAKSFKAFYNSKNHSYANMELHYQFDTKGFHNVGFSEGMVLVLWSGLLKQLNPTAPSNCTPFAFCELQMANMNQKSRLLICTMINQKGGLA